MAQVYSTQFVNLTSGLTSASFTVPAGFKAVLRDVTWFNPNTLSFTAMFTLGPSGQVVQYVEDANPSTNQYHQWEGRVVYGPGGVILMETSAAGPGGSAAGYLLSLP